MKKNKESITPFQASKTSKDAQMMQKKAQIEQDQFELKKK